MKKLLFLLISVNIFAKDVILLLGGINRTTAKYMSKIKDTLSQEGRIIIDDIDVDTINSTINQQADIVYNSLVRDKGISNKDKIIIIGHSQGGLRGYEFYRKYKDNLNILALFTITTPWNGAKVLNKIGLIKNNIEYIKYNLDSHKDLKDIICSYTKDISIGEIDEILSCIPEIKKFLETIQEGIGVQEMKPNSNFIKSLNTLQNEKNLNIFNIIGDKGNIFNFINISENKIREAVDMLVKSKDNIDTACTTGFITGLLGFFTFNPIAAAIGFGVSMASLGTRAGTDQSNLRYLRDLGNAIDGLKNYVKNLHGFGESGDVVLSIYDQIPAFLGIEKEDFQDPFVLAYKKRVENLFSSKNLLGTQASMLESKVDSKPKIPIELIYVKDTIHDFIKVENFGSFKKLKQFVNPNIENKVIYNHTETINFIEKNVDKIFNE